VTASNAKRTIRRLIKGFKKHGLKEGDCVCIVSLNTVSLPPTGHELVERATKSPFVPICWNTLDGQGDEEKKLTIEYQIWYPLLYLGAIGAGACVTGCNPGYTPTELLHHFLSTRPSLLVVQSESLSAVKEAASKCNIAQARIFELKSAAGYEHSDACATHPHQCVSCLLKHGELDWETGSTKHQDASNKVACLNATSGTTGLPKAAVTTHCYVVAQALMLEEQFKDRPYQVMSLLPTHLSKC
jgi:acyl-CoA synthetase (AMP-forming)/AMP-acid ligase II